MFSISKFSKMVPLFHFFYVLKTVHIFVQDFQIVLDLNILFCKFKNVWIFNFLFPCSMFFSKLENVQCFKKYSVFQIFFVPVFKFCSQFQKLCSHFHKFEKCQRYTILFTNQNLFRILKFSFSKIILKIQKMFMFSKFVHKFKKCSHF